MVQCDGCKIDRPAQQIQVIDSGERMCAACISELRGEVPPAQATQPTPQVTVRDVITTQRTSKVFKAQILLSCLLMGREFDVVPVSLNLVKSQIEGFFLFQGQIHHTALDLLVTTGQQNL